MKSSCVNRKKWATRAIKWDMCNLKITMTFHKNHKFSDVDMTYTRSVCDQVYFIFHFFSLFLFYLRKSMISSCLFIIIIAIICRLPSFSFLSFHHSFKFKYNFYPYGKILSILLFFRVNREKQRAIESKHTKWKNNDPSMS